MSIFLEPGQLVQYQTQPEWGVGQIQSVIDEKVTINFENVGKIVIMGEHVNLLVVIR